MRSRLLEMGSPTRRSSAGFLKNLLLPLSLWLASSSIQTPGAERPVLRGTVRDESGAPVAGAKVSLLDARLSRQCPDLFIGSPDSLYLAAGPKWRKPQSWRMQAAASSDRQGNFELVSGKEVASGILVTTADGFAPDLEPVVEGALRNVVLERGERVVVRFLNNAQKPVTNGEGSLVPLSLCMPIIQAMPELFVWKQRGDADGTLTFRNVPRGTYGMKLEGASASTSVSPLVVRKGGAEYRVEAPEDFDLKGSVAAPSRIERGTGSVLAYWKERNGAIQWSEAAYSPEEGSFAMNRVPWDPNIRFFAWSDSGLYSPIVTREDLGNSESPLEHPIQLYLPARWYGRLSEGASVTSLVVQFLLPDEAPPGMRFEPVEVTVDAARRFVIPEVPPPTTGARLIAPGIGAVEVKLQVGSTGDLGTVRLQPGRTIQGRAIWEDRSPLQDAEIAVLSASGMLCEAPADSDGGFACAPAGAIPAPKELRFRARVGEAEFQLAPRPGDAPSTLVADPGIPVTIHVSRTAGKDPVEDLRLELDSRSTGERGSSHRAPGVRYARAPEGDLNLHLIDSRPGMLDLSNPEGVPRVGGKVAASADAAKNRLAWVLPEAPSLSGIVAAASSGRPIEGAEVGIGVSPSAPDGSVVSRLVHTGAGGSWRQEGFPEGSYRAIASATGYSPAGKLIAIPAEARISHRLLLTSPGRIHGRVLGIPEKGEGGIRATSKSSEVGWSQYQADLDSKGEFTLESVRPDNYIMALRVRVPVPGKASLSSMSRRNLTVLVKPGETSEIEIDLRQGITLSGEARLGAAPLRSTDVTFFRIPGKDRNGTLDRTITDDEGRYRISLPGAGKYYVRARQEERKVLQLDRWMEVRREKNQTQDLRFSDGSIRGRLVNGDGKPWSGVPVVLERAGDWLYTGEVDSNVFVAVDSTISGEDGSFELRPEAAGEYILSTGLKAEPLTQEVGPFSLGHDQTLDLQDVVLKPESEIRVLTLDAAGAPIDPKRVSAYQGINAWLGYSGASGKRPVNGVTILEGLAPGTYTLVGIAARQPPAILENVEVPIKDSPVPLTMQFTSGGSLDLIALGVNGEPLPNEVPQIIDGKGRDMIYLYDLLESLGSDRWATDSQGRAHLSYVLPGEYIVRIAGGGKSAERSITIVPGQTASVKLVIEGD